MGKRLIRIYHKDIQAQSGKLIRMKINLVLQNQSTFHGMLIGIDNEGLNLNDMLNRKHHVKFSDIVEIVYDKVAAY
jgi:ribosome maturation factor RimP